MVIHEPHPSSKHFPKACANPGAYQIPKHFSRLKKLPNYIWLAVLLCAFSGAIPQAYAEESPDDAVDKWLTNVAQIEVDSIADKILDDLRKQGFPTSGNRRDALKGLVKKNLKKSMKQSVRTEDMDAIVRKIAAAMTQKGKPVRRATMEIAYALPSDLSFSRGISGMFNTYLDLAESVLTGGIGTAKKLVLMTGKKLALEAAKKMLGKLKQLQDKLKKKGGVEVYRSSRETKGCDISMAVFWNKVSGVYKFVILGDCNCEKIGKVYLGRWSVTGKGKAKWRNGRIADLSIRTSENPKRGIKVHGYCCGKKENSTTYTRNDNPWDIKIGVGKKRQEPKPEPTQSPRVNQTKEDENQLPEPVKGSGEGIADIANVSKDIPIIPSGPVATGEKEEWIEKAGAAYAGAREMVEDKQAKLDRSIGDNASESEINQARLDLEAARETLKKAEAALDAAYQLKVKTESDGQSSNFDEDNGEWENISLYQCTAEGLEGSLEEYVTRFYGEQRWECKDNDCQTFNRSETGESLELYLNYLAAAEREARKKLPGHPRESVYNFILEKNGLYDYHKQMLCQSMEALKERCAVSRQDLGEIRAGTQEVMNRHRHIMRILKYSKRSPANSNISDYSKSAKKRFIEPLLACDTC